MSTECESTFVSVPKQNIFKTEMYTYQILSKQIVTAVNFLYSMYCFPVWFPFPATAQCMTVIICWRHLTKNWTTDPFLMSFALNQKSKNNRDTDVTMKVLIRNKKNLPFSVSYCCIIIFKQWRRWGLFLLCSTFRDLEKINMQMWLTFLSFIIQSNSKSERMKRNIS